MTTRRLYYDDSFQRDFEARVLSCEPEAYGSTPAWAVVLDSTALYPTSGGQPHDLGKLGDANVLDVRDEEEDIVHIVDRELKLGDIQCCVDWARRFDHMQQHTGQHLLSAMFQERYGRPTVSFHLGSEMCTIDIRGPEPTEDILEGAERAANQVIAEDRPVMARYGTAEEIEELGVRKKVERSGILRVIEIEGADLQPCGGTHVNRTSQIGNILVRRASKISQEWRIGVGCGGGGERVARRDFLLLRGVAEKLSCATEDVVTAAERAVSERDAHFKSARALLERLAEAEATIALTVPPPDAKGDRVMARLFGEETETEYLGYFATQFVKSEKTVALLARSTLGELLFAQHASAGNDMNALLKQVLTQFGGKGGGTRDFARGRLNDGAQAEKAVDFAERLLTAG